MEGGEVEDLLRRMAPQVLGALVRRYGHFDSAEDAVQEAVLAAATQWPAEGTPDNPRGWLITVASRRLTDLLRSDQARRRREDTAARWVMPVPQHAAPSADTPISDADDTLIVLVLCCHPALDAAAQIALTLRAVGRLSTAEIARAFLVSEATMTRRMSRAKQRITSSGTVFGMPTGPDRAARLDAVGRVLYLMFTEGYTATAGANLQRPDLAAEAIRLTRLLLRLLPADSEVAGLLALMLLTDARRPARTGPHGELIPLPDQDRTRWNTTLITEGVELITVALPRGPVGPYQLQAAIAAIHDESTDPDATDWPQITALYQLLLKITDHNPVVALNHAVAVAMTRGPHAGLALLGTVQAEPRITEGHHLPAVRAHLLEMTGDTAAAREAYQTAASRTTNLAQHRYLNTRAARLNDD
ncbi:MAG: sigma-70 family RNA polymerase sigma factor [Actinomycetota bacterium]|nr:sigma-70 family RNA polymerase sigma factor [Actinomycetota bacterium]